MSTATNKRATSSTTSPMSTATNNRIATNQNVRYDVATLVKDMNDEHKRTTNITFNEVARWREEVEEMNFKLGHNSSEPNDNGSHRRCDSFCRVDAIMGTVWHQPIFMLVMVVSGRSRLGPHEVFVGPWSMAFGGHGTRGLQSRLGQVRNQLDTWAPW